MAHSLDGVRGRPLDERWTVDIGLLDCSGRGKRTDLRHAPVTLEMNVMEARA
jgi:hypothetical protein